MAFLYTQAAMLNNLLPTEETRITMGCLVDLHFSVCLEQGQEIDNSRNGREAPVQLTLGDGNLLVGFENVLIGLRAGDRRTALLPPEDAFGQWNADNVQRFDARAFDTLPEVGMVMEFEDPQKNTLPGVVKAIEEDAVLIDFNHPLAGQSLLFEVEIFKVTPAGASRLDIR